LSASLELFRVPKGDAVLWFKATAMTMVLPFYNIAILIQMFLEDKNGAIVTLLSPLLKVKKF
jgi:hypothetical protein